MKNHTLIQVFFLVILFHSYNLFSQDTLIIYPTKDAVISSANQTQNYGSDQRITASSASGPTDVLRSLINFELDSIPDSAYIYSATLILDGSNHDNGTGSNAFILQRITQSWSESTVTWMNQPSSVSTDQISLDASITPDEDYEIDIRLHLVDMLDGGNAYGFMMKLNSESPTTRIEFNSSDASSGDLPKIIIVYEVPSPMHLELNAGSLDDMTTSSGIIELEVYGGISPYEYSWSDGTNTWETEDLSELSIGIYSITVGDELEEEVSSQISVGYAMRFSGTEVLSNTNFESAPSDPCFNQVTENANRSTVSSWDNGIRSNNSIPSGDDGWVEYTVESDQYNRMFGLSDIESSGGQWEDIEYGLYMNSENDLIRVESGSQYELTEGTYLPGDVLRVGRDGVDIVYTRNGNLLYTSSEVGNGDELAIDLNIYQAGATMSGLRTSAQIPFTIGYEVVDVSNYEDPDGSITITTTSMEGLGGSFTYEWKKDGETLIGETTNTLENLDAGIFDLTLTNSNTGYILRKKFAIANDGIMMWELTKSYDRAGTIIGSTKQYYNSLNKLLQSQSKNLSETDVIVSQPLYDVRGRLVAGTLPAPAFMSDYGYLPQFISNSAGSPYSYLDFDIPNYTSDPDNLTVNEVDYPAPVSDYDKGSVGWYYSDRNNEEKMVATTAFPYSRMEYNNNAMDAVKRSSAPHNELKMGSGRNAESFTMLTGGELKRVYGYISGWAGGDFLEDEESGCDVMVAKDYVGVDDFKPFKKISYDADSMETVSFFTNTGWLIATAYSGTSQSGLNEDTYSTSIDFTVTNRDGEDYVDIHLPKGCEGTLHIEPEETTVCAYKILDLRTDRYLESSPDNTTFTSKTPELYGSVDIPAGTYRIVYLKGCADQDHVFNVYHDVNYYDYTLYYYDYAGRLLSIVPPKGIDLYVDYPSNSSSAGGGSTAFVTGTLEGNPAFGLSSLGNTEMNISLTEPTSEGEITLNSYLFYLDTDAGLLGGDINFEDEYLSTLSNNEEGGALSMKSAQRQFWYKSEADWSGDDCGCQSPASQCIDATSFSEALISGREYCANGYAHVADMGEGKYCLSCETTPMLFVKKFTVDFTIENNTGEGNEVLSGGRILVTQYEEGWDFSSENLLQMSNVPGAIVFNQLLHYEDEAPEIELHINNVSVYEPLLDGESIWDGITEVGTGDYAGLENLDVAYERVIYYLNPNPSHSMYSLYDYNSRNELLSAVETDEGKTEYYYSAEGLLRFSQDELQQSSDKFSYYRYDNAYRVIESGELDCVESGSYTGYYFENHYGDVRCSGNEPISTIADDLDFDFDEEYTKTYPTFVEYDREYTNSELGDEIYFFMNDPASDGYCQRNVRGRISTSRVAKEKVPTFLSPPALPYDEKTQSKTWYSYLPDGRLEWTIQKIYEMPSYDPESYYSVITTDYTYNHAGAVSNVRLQKDLPSQYFEHRYTYDSDIRLSKVETRTSSGGSWREVAEYEYYLHGPLKRTELDDDLQGIDYVYNTMGWLKSINSPNLGYNDCWKFVDPGKDGFEGSDFEEDVFGMTIDYFFKDYERKNSNVNYGDRQSYPTPVPDRYTGLIESIRWNTAEAGHGTPPAIGQRNMDHWTNVYLYDNKGWLTEAKFGSFDEGCQNARKYDAECFVSTVGYYVNGHYKFNEDPDEEYLVTNITYDGNGNIQTMKRNSYDVSGSDMDDFDYSYADCGNRLDHIDDAIGSGLWTEDLDDQGSGYYEYDELGRIVTIGVNNLKIEYNLHGLVDIIRKYYSGSSSFRIFLSFRYDEHGNRLSKTVYDLSENEAVDTYWYINNAGGVNMAVYYQDNTATPYSYADLTEHSLLGLGKIGDRLKGSPDRYQYAVSDHLGSVRATVYRNGFNDLVIDKYADYYPWGMEMPGRTANLNNYRHGYQGQFAERDDETKYTSFELRQLDARMARWMSTDPYYQHHSPYMAMGNNPVSGIDPDGGFFFASAASSTLGCAAGSAAAGGLMANILAGGVVAAMTSNFTSQLSSSGLSSQVARTGGGHASGNHRVDGVSEGPYDIEFINQYNRQKSNPIKAKFEGDDSNDPLITKSRSKFNEYRYLSISVSLKNCKADFDPNTSDLDENKVYFRFYEKGPDNIRRERFGYFKRPNDFDIDNGGVRLNHDVNLVDIQKFLW